MSTPSQTGCACGCREAAGATAHEVLVALRDDDVDRAIEAGLLDCAPCTGCSPECTQILQAARDARLTALAARDRYRARMERLERRTSARAARRAKGTAAGSANGTVAPALPAAAAAALARAKAKAAGPRKP